MFDECKSLIFEFVFLSFQMALIFATASIVCAALEVLLQYFAAILFCVGDNLAGFVAPNA